MEDTEGLGKGGKVVCPLISRNRVRSNCVLNSRAHYARVNYKLKLNHFSPCLPWLTFPLRLLLLVFLPPIFPHLGFDELEFGDVD